MEIKIAPSLLAGDFVNIESEIKKCEAAGADMIHIDVMDGHFVPNITIGVPVVKSIRKVTALPLDVHLMISEPIKYIDAFADVGADIITVHLESDGSTAEAIEQIKKKGCLPSVSVKPKTDVNEVMPYIDSLAMVLVMTVEPGFGGQKFMGDMMPKVKAIREYSKSIDIEVDGGIDAHTIKDAAAAGANIFVAGSAVFNRPSAADAVAELRRGAEAGSR